MTTLDDARKAVTTAISTISFQRTNPATTPEQLAALDAALQKLLPTLHQIEAAQLDEAAETVAAATNALRAVTEDARLDTIAQLRQQIGALLQPLDDQHPELPPAPTIARRSDPGQPSSPLPSTASTATPRASPIEPSNAAIRPQPIPASASSADFQIAWGRFVDSAFKQGLLAACARLAVDPNFLMACMAFETGQSFRSDKVNPVSGATGLIQFMPSTAHALGTTTVALAAMTAVEQLTFVERYFSPHTGKLKTLSDVYMAILWPKAIGQPESFVLFALPSIEYQENRGLDSNNDGQVTKAEAAARVHQMLITGLAKSNLG